MKTSRRAFLKAGAAAAIASPFPIKARASEVLNIAAYGGEFQEVFTKTTIVPFEKKFSCKVVYDAAGTNHTNYAKIRASKGSPGFDVAAELTLSQNILGARDKLLETVTEKEVPNIKYQWPNVSKLMPANGVAHNVQYVSLIWNTKKIKKPESWLDYWQPQATYGDGIKGHVLAHGMSNFDLSSYALIMGARAKGGDERRMDEAWKLLRAQKPFLGPIADTSSAAVPYLENEQVWIGPYWSARSAYYKKRGFPIDFTTPKEGTIGIMATASVPIGAKNKRLAFEFLNFRMDPEIQFNFCTEYSSSPGRSDLTGWPADFAETQVTTMEKMNSLIFPDLDHIATQIRPWTETWQDIMAS